MWTALYALYFKFRWVWRYTIENNPAGKVLKMGMWSIVRKSLSYPRLVGGSHHVCHQKPTMFSSIYHGGRSPRHVHFPYTQFWFTFVIHMAMGGVLGFQHCETQLLATLSKCWEYRSLLCPFGDSIMMQ